MLAATASLGDEIKEELRELDELIEMGEKLVKEGSTSKEAKRLIEVKSFKAEGEIEMSSNEWRVASENKDNYYLYVVNYALSEPKLIIVQDPYNKLKDIARIVPLQDFKVIIPKLES